MMWLSGLLIGRQRMGPSSGRRGRGGHCCNNEGLSLSLLCPEPASRRGTSTGDGVRSLAPEWISARTSLTISLSSARRSGMASKGRRVAAFPMPMISSSIGGFNALGRPRRQLFPVHAQTDGANRARDIKACFFSSSARTTAVTTTAATAANCRSLARSRRGPIESRHAIRVGPDQQTPKHRSACLVRGPVR